VDDRRTKTWIHSQFRGNNLLSTLSNFTQHPE